MCGLKTLPPLPSPKKTLIKNRLRLWSPRLKVGKLTTQNGSFVRFYKDRIEYDVLVHDEGTNTQTSL